MNKYSISLVFLLCFVATSVWGATIDCVNTDATANGFSANACSGDDWTTYGSSEPANEESFVNNVFGDVTDPFGYVAKYEFEENKTEGVAGWEITAAAAPAGASYSFVYSLSAPSEFKGATFDFVLGVKQANDSFIAYLFEQVVMDVSGNFNSTWTNPSDNTDIAFSHVTAFVRGAAPVPEPSTLFLLGGGLVGLAVWRRRKN